VLDHPDAVGALDLWASCEGKPGVDGLQRISTHAADALHVIDSARAARQRAELENVRKEAGRGRRRD
jgi:hypothetical protein